MEKRGSRMYVMLLKTAYVITAKTLK